MCGRTGLSLNKEKVQCACSYKLKGANLYTKPDWLHEHNDGKEYLPSYNIAPTDVTPVLVSAANYTAKTERVLKPMMWGIIPPWHKGDYKTHNLSTNNCRFENIKDSKLYGPILKNGGRCIVVVEGFYEWQTTNKFSKVKQPYYIYAPQSENIKLQLQHPTVSMGRHALDRFLVVNIRHKYYKHQNFSCDRFSSVDDTSTWNNSFDEENGWSGIKLLHLAGLYHVWQNNNRIIYSYSIITMDSNSTLEWLHHRMPAVLDTEEQIQAWLDVDSVDSNMALSYLRPVKILCWHLVSTLVNNSRNKSTECNKRITPEQKTGSTQKTLTQWFTKTEKRKSTDETQSAAKKIKN